MTLQEYINQYYDGSSTWFVDECKRTWQTGRIDNVLSIREYLNGKHAILARPDEKYNGRTFKTRKIILQYAKTLLNFETVFLLKNPVTLTSEDKPTLEAFKDVYSKGRYNSLDFKLLDKIVKYGEAYEYIYFDDNKNIVSKIILPEDSYPVFAADGALIAFIEHYIVDGVSYYTVYENDVVRTYTDAGGTLKQTGEYVNISGLPIQYKTLDEEDDCKGRSSLEDYISILDNMEDLISKYLDSFYKFLNPIPVLKGQKLKIGKAGEGAIDPATVGHVLQIEDGSEFKLEQNKMDYQSLKELWDILKQSLLDISMTPGVSMNSQEISNLSEVSIKMLFYMATVKGSLNSQYLMDGFIKRWNRIKKLLEFKNVSVLGDVSCTFEMSIPQNEKEIIENIKTLKEAGLISIETALSRTPYIYDVQTELTRLNSESIQNVGDNKG
jgi:SPP1 family phage portal protein